MVAVLLKHLAVAVQGVQWGEQEARLPWRFESAGEDGLSGCERVDKDQ